MGNDNPNRGPADVSRVNVDEECEIHYWTKKFGVSADHLRAAVDSAGPSAEAVGHWLTTNH